MQDLQVKTVHELLESAYFPPALDTALDTSLHHRLVHPIQTSLPQAIVDKVARALLYIWAVDSTPAGVAVTLEGDRLPLSARLLTLILIDRTACLNLDEYLNPLGVLISELGREMLRIAGEGDFPIVQEPPDTKESPNLIYRYHQETHGNPLYKRVAARVHLDLVRRVNRAFREIPSSKAGVERVKEAKRKVDSFTVPLRRVTKHYPTECIPAPLYILDWNEKAALAFEDNVKEVTSKLVNLKARGSLIAKRTQKTYARNFMNALDIKCLKHKGAIHPQPGRRGSTDLDVLDTDPRETEDDPLAAASYADGLRHETEEDGLALPFGEGWLDPDILFADQLLYNPHLEGMKVREIARRRNFLRDRAPLSFIFDRYDWPAVALPDLARGYAILSHGFSSLQEMGVTSLARLLLYDLLLVTGRRWSWLMSLQIGSVPENPPEHPILDLQRFEVFFVPKVHPALPGSDEEKRWSVYDEVSLVRSMPLDPIARLLTTRYRKLRSQALKPGKAVTRDLQSVATDKSGPLFIVRDRRHHTSQYTRKMEGRDVTRMIQDVNESRREERPDAPAVSRPRLRRAAVTHLLEHWPRNDRIAVHTITGRHFPGLRATLFYTLLDSKQLQTDYHTAVRGFRETVEGAYEAIEKKEPIWRREKIKPPSPSITSRQRFYGATYHPRETHIRAVVEALTTNARQPPSLGMDPASQERARQDALTALCGYFLSLFLGLRVGEVAELRRGEIHLPNQEAIQTQSEWSLRLQPRGLETAGGLVVIKGKRDRFFEERHVLPIPQPLAALVRQVLNNSARASGTTDQADAAFYFYRSLSVPYPARRHHLWNYLDRIASSPGLEEGAPRWHSTRHFLRTFLYRQGLEERTINYVLGHQAAGSEVGNRYVPSQLSRIFKAYLEAAEALFEWLELDFNGLT